MKSSWDEVKEKCLVKASRCMEEGSFAEAERLLNMALGVHNAIDPEMQSMEEFLPNDLNGHSANMKPLVINREVVLNFDMSCLDDIEEKMECLNRKASQLGESLAEVLDSASSLGGLFK